jgi:chromosome segregation ATPase
VGTKDELAYLEEERKKLWEEVSSLKNEIRKIQKQTPEEVKAILDKSAQIDQLQGQIATIHSVAVTQNQKIDSSTAALAEAVSHAEELKVNFDSIYSEGYKLFQAASANSTELLNLSGYSKEIKTTLDTLLADFKAKSETLTELNEILDEATSTEEKINLIHTNVDKYHKETRSLFTKIFGYDKENEDGTKSKVPGLKDELEVTYKSLETKLNELHGGIDTALALSIENSIQVQKYWEIEHGSLKERIKSLLPEALTAGLSHAYEKKKEDELEAMGKSNRLFEAAIVGLVAVSLIPFIVSVYLLSNGTGIEDAILKLPRLAISIFPLYVPILWMAYSSSKKVNLSKRLIEEYSHKEALSKTFEGLSEQINNIKDGHEKYELKAKLLYNLLEVSAENPGKLIYDYNNADHPLMDALDKSVKLGEAITRIAKIPGMSKFTNALIEKEKRIQSDMSDKVNEGLQSSEDMNRSKK